MMGEESTGTDCSIYHRKALLSAFQFANEETKAQSLLQEPTASQ